MPRADSTDTTLPTVTELLREYKIFEAKCDLDILMAQANMDDETIAEAIYKPAWARQEEIMGTLAESEPTNSDEIGGMIALVVKILEEDGTHESELEVLRAAKQGVYNLLDPWRQKKAA